jgi:hypothetical protein
MATVKLQVHDQATVHARGLTALALCGGNSVHASNLCGVPDSTLRQWRKEKATEYERVRRELAPRLEQIAVQELQAFVVQASQTKLLALAKTHKALEDDLIPARDLGSLLRNIATAEAIACDKILALQGRPTQIVEHRSPDAILKRLAAIGAVVDGSAVEIAPPAPTT